MPFMNIHFSQKVHYYRVNKEIICTLALTAVLKRLHAEIRKIRSSIIVSIVFEVYQMNLDKRKI